MENPKIKLLWSARPNSMQAKCPYCGAEDCEADWCDIGVGFQQVGPFLCFNCGASQIGPFDENPVTAEEKRTGWFKPGNLGTTANTFNGLHVGYKTAEKMYEMGILDPKRDVKKLS